VGRTKDEENEERELELETVQLMNFQKFNQARLVLVVLFSADFNVSLRKCKKGSEEL